MAYFDLMLNTVTYAAKHPGAPRVVLLHGFTQSAGVWDEIANQLTDEFEVVCVDLPGHGKSPRDHDEADLWRAAELVGEAAGEAIYVGYSLGARVATHLAVANEQLVEGLIVIGGKIGYRDDHERNERIKADAVTAYRLEDADEQELSDFIDEWLNLSFNLRVPTNRQFRELRLKSRGKGLAASLRNCGSGVQASLWDEIAKLTMPVMLVQGEHDLPGIKQDTQDAFEAIGINAMSLTVNNCGHCVPFELDPTTMTAIISDFVAATT